MEPDVIDLTPINLKRSINSTGAIRKLPKMDNDASIESVASEPSPDESVDTSALSAEPKAEEQNSRPRLDTLPEEILIIIFSKLDVIDLFNLTKCSSRMHNIVRYTSKLWIHVYDECNGFFPCHKRLMPFLTDYTTTLHLHKKDEEDVLQAMSPSENTVYPNKETIGFSWRFRQWGASSNNASDSGHFLREANQRCVDLDFFKSLKKLLHLKSLIIDNHTLHDSTLNLDHLPECLTELTLMNITLRGENLERFHLFINLHEQLPHLEVLDVSYCQWVKRHMLHSLAKCTHLKKLVMVGCKNINGMWRVRAEVPISGFGELEILDLRLASVSICDLRYFKHVPKLKHILLEEPPNLRGFPGYGDDDFFLDEAELSVYVNDWLETLVLRNYLNVNNSTIDEIERSFKSIKYLDLSGTNCDWRRVAIFQKQRPEVRVVYEFGNLNKVLDLTQYARRAFPL